MTYALCALAGFLIGVGLTVSVALYWLHQTPFV